MLLPKSQAKQRYGQPQEPRAQCREKRTCRSRPERSSEAKWQTTTDRRDGTQNGSKRCRNACALFQNAFPSRALTTARGWDGHSATYKTSTFIDDHLFPAHLRPAGSGNARLVCAVLCHNCATPDAIRAPAFAGHRVSDEHQPAWFASEGAQARTAASGFRANSIVLEFRSV